MFTYEERRVLIKVIKSKILNRIFILVLIIIFISTLFVSVYAENEVSNDNTMNTSTNSVRQLSLQEQKNQVEEQLAIASEQLQYVEGEISEFDCCRFVHKVCLK